MRRHLCTLVLSGLLGGLFLSSSAQAQCCLSGFMHKSSCATPACEPCAAPVVECSPQCAPPPCPPPCPPPKSCCFASRFGKHGLFCHQPKCAPSPCIDEPCGAPVGWGGPIASPQWGGPSPQWTSSPQWVAPTMQAPSKQGW
jgi:hypothetical protein